MEDLKKAYKRAVILGLALMGGVLAAAGFVELAVSKQVPFPHPAPISRDQAELTVYFLLVVSGAVFFVIKYLQQHYLQGSLMFMPDDRQATEAELSTAKLLTLLIVVVMSYLLCEVPMIFGLVLFFLTDGNALYFYIFMVMSLLFFAFYFPRYRQWEVWMREKKADPDA